MAREQKTNSSTLECYYSIQLIVAMSLARRSGPIAIGFGSKNRFSHGIPLSHRSCIPSNPKSTNRMDHVRVLSGMPCASRSPPHDDGCVLVVVVAGRYGVGGGIDG